MEEFGGEPEPEEPEATWLDTGYSRGDVLRAALVGGAALSLPGLLAEQAYAGLSSLAVRKGGTLRVGQVGGGASETLNPNQLLAEMDLARSRCLFEGLTGFDSNGKVINVLAKEFSPNARATVWKARIRDDVVFHNGKTLDADDVVRSFRYILNPKNKTQGLGTLTDLKPGKIRKLDRSTVEFRLERPNAFLPGILGNERIRIFYGTNFARPVGTGPFKFKSWTRGVRSLFVRHPEYRNGLPYLDAVEYIAINDANARLNALIAGQIDLLAQLDPKLVGSVTGNSRVKLIQKAGGTYTAMYVQTDVAPFTDNRVRQALRYAIDRPQILTNALSGRGRIGNDLPCWFDEDYASGIAQRPYDPERARSLLKAAGQEGLKLELQTSDVAPGMLESSTLFAQQAKQAGVTISLRQWPTDQYYSSAYAHFPFAMTNWGGRPLASQINLAYLTKSPYNETNFHNAELDAVVSQAFAAGIKTKRRSLMVDAQKILWNEGGTIIWGFLANLDAGATKVRGLSPSVIRNLGNYDLSRVWLAA